MKRLILLSLMLTVVLAGCKVDVKTDLYISDIRAVRYDGKALETDGLLMFQIPTQDTFTRKQADIERLLKTYFKGVENIRTIKQGMEHYVVANIQVPIYKSQDGNTDLHETISFAVMDLREKYNLTGVVLAISEQEYQKLSNDVQKQFIGKLDPDSFRVTVYVNNDGRGPEAINVSSVYLDGKPIPGYSTITLKKRGKRELVVSRIATINALKSGGDMFLRLNEPKGE